jgi:hypothetical protein
MNWKTQPSYTDRKDESYVVHNFGHKDRFGREIGAGVKTYRVKFDDIGEEKKALGYGGYDRAPGYYLALNVQSTRAGERYGASQGTQFFDSEAERDAAIAKRLKAMAKGAQKREGK